jgi:hypothetical protein
MVTYNVFFDSLISFFYLPFFEFFFFFMERNMYLPSLQNLRHFNELLKRARAGQAGPAFLASGPKKAKSRVGAHPPVTPPGPHPKVRP